MKAYEDLFKVGDGVPEKLGADGEPLASAAHRTLDLAVKYAYETVKADGYWCGELRSNATITAEYMFLRQALGLNLKVDSDALRHWFFSKQRPNRSWSIAPGDFPGDISTTTEAYLALKILGIPSDAPSMQRARKLVITQGGVQKVRIFISIYLATFGLFSKFRTGVACRAHTYASLGTHQYLQAVILGTQHDCALAHGQPPPTHLSIA